ncbi:MAG: XRE family transcriptional regulator [Clostridia bacterium]|jgi:transcriptional regulator with XRE-family HTH domain|nr:XRE family transcriptional regulator [Clostridia bacterium]
MKIRKQSYGNKNLIGKNVETLRKKQCIAQKDFVAKLQVAGLNINPTSYSKLEGQIRAASDKEVFIIAKTLKVAIEKLFENSKME